ncbi:MAG: hypothetical protein FJ044_00885 [Candidatus Cloacimonetes bacterium]|nr:hypothetical protein [Candidatus Cloacimonadota bacterium]
MANTKTKTPIKNFQLSLPKWVVEITTPQKVVCDFMLSVALSKIQEYKAREEVFEKKYHLAFPKFEKKVLAAKEENFQHWDDLIDWEAAYLAHKLWQERYQQLISK